MSVSMSAAQVLALLKKKAEPRPKKPKYRNKKVVIDGITFDSEKEGRRYEQLKLLQRAKEISDLEVQVPFELTPAVKYKAEARQTPAMRYLADFVYIDNRTGLHVVEDVKSAMTRKLRPYRIKKHLMLVVHGIEIFES